MKDLDHELYQVVGITTNVWPCRIDSTMVEMSIQYSKLDGENKGMNRSGDGGGDVTSPALGCEQEGAGKVGQTI